jgi:hypothetical protein
LITVLKICKSLWMLFSGVVSFWFKQTIERLVQYIMDKVFLFLRCVLMTWANLRDVFSIEFMIVMFVDVITSLKNKVLFNNAKFSFHHFQQYFSYIVAVSFIGGGNRSTRRKQLTCRKSLTSQDRTLNFSGDRHWLHR